MEASQLKRADVYFILEHKVTKNEIIMPVLGICEEYGNCSLFTTSAKN